MHPRQRVNFQRYDSLREREMRQLFPLHQISYQTMVDCAGGGGGAKGFHWTQINPLVPGNFLCEFFDESSYRGGLWK